MYELLTYVQEGLIWFPAFL